VGSTASALRPARNFADHPGLQATEVGVPKGVAQDVARGVEPILRHGDRE